jgi:hypothetical protein
LIRLFSVLSALSAGQLPHEAPDKAGVSKDMLFFEDSLANRRKAFGMAFFYINYGIV